MIIKPKRSETIDNIPTNLEIFEIAFNIPDQKFFIKGSDGNINTFNTSKFSFNNMNIDENNKIHLNYSRSDTNVYVKQNTRLNIVGNKDQYKLLGFHVGDWNSSTVRWQIGIDANSESSSRDGADFKFFAYDNNGSNLVTVMTLTRSGSTNIPNLVSDSDIRLKSEVTDIDNVDDRFESLAKSAKKFKMNSDRYQIGFIANDLEDTCPELITKIWNENLEDLSLALSYDRVSAILVKKIEQLENRIKELESQ